MKARLSALADWLEGRDYLVDRFTVADILMTAMLRLIRHTDLVAGFPTLDAYAKSLGLGQNRRKERSESDAAAPEPDAPKRTGLPRKPAA